MHPHRGIETISYVSRGKMVHRDSLGNEAGISDGEVQWMNSGSGIMHEENGSGGRKAFRSTVVAEFTGQKIK